MDPVTTAIVAALVAGVTAGAADVGKEMASDAYAGTKQVIVDGYTALKSAITRKFGENRSLTNALEGVEIRPEDELRQEMLRREVDAAGVDQDAEIRAEAEKLLALIQAQPGGEQLVQRTQTAIGNYNAQVQGDNSSASVNVNQPDSPSDTPSAQRND